MKLIDICCQGDRREVLGRSGAAQKVEIASSHSLLAMTKSLSLRAKRSNPKIFLNSKSLRMDLSDSPTQWVRITITTMTEHRYFL